MQIFYPDLYPIHTIEDKVEKIIANVCYLPIEVKKLRNLYMINLDCC